MVRCPGCAMHFSQYKADSGQTRVEPGIFSFGKASGQLSGAATGLIEEASIASRVVKFEQKCDDAGIAVVEVAHADTVVKFNPINPYFIDIHPEAISTITLGMK